MAALTHGTPDQPEARHVEEAGPGRPLTSVRATVGRDGAVVRRWPG